MHLACLWTWLPQRERMNSGGERKKEIKGPFPSARLHSMGSFLKGIIEVCVFLLRFVLVSFSRALRRGGVVCSPSPSTLRKKLQLVFPFFFYLFFSAARSLCLAHTLLLHKSNLSQPHWKLMWVLLWVFTNNVVKPGVPKHNIKASNPQISLQDPSQVFLDSVPGTVGTESILGLSPLFLHPVAEVNQQHVGCTPEAVLLFIVLCDLLVWLLKARSAAKLIFVMHSWPQSRRDDI